MGVNKPFLRKRNRGTGLRDAKFHKNWIENQQRQVLWSDEIFALSLQYIWRRSGERYNSECVQQSGKRGGVSVVVRSCISVSDVGNLVKIDGTIKTE